MNWLSCVLALGLLLPVPAYAVTTGVQLKEMSDAYQSAVEQVPSFNCVFHGEDAFNAPRFIGYIEGVKDAVGQGQFCIPKDTQKREVYSTVRKYLLDNPQELNKSGDELVSRALRSTFPCKNR